MFDFTVRYLGFLKSVPLLPHLFDALLRIVTLLSNKALLDYMDEIENEVRSWRRTSVHVHKFGGIQFNLRDKEIGHIHGNGLLDILFSRSIKTQLLREGKVSDHHIFRNSGWVSFYIRTRQDRDAAIALLRQSYDLKR